MTEPGRGPTRRRVLTASAAGALGLGLAGVGLAGCTDSGTTATPTAGPDAGLLEHALGVERVLLAEVAAGESAGATLGQARAVVVTHVAALASVAGRSVPAGATATPGPSGQAAAWRRRVAAGCRTAARAHLAVLPEAGPATARLLASVAASDLALAEQLAGRG